MSDSTTAAAAEGVQAETDAAAAAAAALAADPAASAGTTDPAPTPEETAAAEAAEAAKKPERTDRRFANLTRKMGDETRAREAAERRAEAAEALLAAGKTGDGEKPLVTPPARTEPDREQLRAELRFNDRLSEIDAAGKKELGTDQWEAAKATLTGLGAVRNVAFLQALAETENPSKIFAAMADDTDQLMELLSKPPAAMAARLGRLDASFAKPVVKTLSGAPKPATKVDGGGGPPPVDIYDPKMPMADFQREMDKILPPHLGGKRKVSA